MASIVAIALGAAAIGAAAIAAAIVLPIKFKKDSENLQKTLRSNEAITERQCKAQEESARITGFYQLQETKDTNRTDIILQRDWIAADDKANKSSEKKAELLADAGDSLFFDYSEIPSEYVPNPILPDLSKMPEERPYMYPNAHA